MAELLHLLPYLASILISAGVGLACLRRGARAGARIYGMVALAQASWSAFIVLELLAGSPAAMMFWDSAQLLPVPVITGGFVLFALAFGGWRVRRPALLWSLLALPGLPLLALYFLAPTGPLTRPGMSLIDAPPFTVLYYDLPATFLWTAAYWVGLYVVATVVLVAHWMRTYPPYRRQLTGVMLGSFLPVAGALLTVTVLSDVPGRDISPFMFALGNVLIGWGLLRHGLFELAPIAASQIVEHLADAVFVLDREGRVVTANAAARALAFRPGTVTGESADDVVPVPADLLAAGVLESVRADVVMPGRTPRVDMDVSIQPLRDHAGARQGTLVLLRDVTDRKRIESELRASEDRFHRMANNVPGMVYQWLRATDGTARFTYASRGALEYLGVDPDELVGRVGEADGRVHEDDRAGFRASVLESQQTLAPWSWSGRALRPDGEVRWVQAQAQPQALPDGSVLWDGIIVDITEQHRMREELRAALEALAAVNDELDARVQARTRELFERDEQLRHAQKMEAIGRLAGGIAHDFNNLLMAIAGHAKLALRNATAAPVQANLEEVIRSADRAASLTRRLLAFSRREVVRPTRVSVDRVAADMRTMLQRLIGDDVSLELALDAPDTHVLADVSQLEQVVLNLVVNAREAMPGGGSVRVSTRRLRESPAVRGLDARGPCIELVVADTGAGMDADARQRAFEPFFTTKEHGSGLGLSIVYGIVEQCGGTVWIESEPRRGSAVHILLPHAAGDGASEPVVATTPSGVDMRGTGERVLLVENEPGVRAYVAAELRHAGYDVVEASDPATALDALELDPVAPALLVTDVVMPGMNGVELARRLLAQRPSLRVLYMSGHVPDELARHGLADDAAFLQKPVSPDALRAAVRNALGPALGALEVRT